ncbi:hypothetical protein GYMLUDRAFT_177610 [Collybiopsis luxurians FD-317 M1]|uniref:Conidiation-specific protein 6 n=1 Tax=Collybiopsis luxurians FD-317 M1 TaxID=944289 RepID=A0A0D0AUG9_9AGAR|nr:hypothetical protein GYMLUDRAFT_177610 [Collybiopsis luxurians FD-317 M1]
MSDNSQKNPERVAAGLRGTLHNDNVSQQAKDKASDRLQEMGASFENKTDTSGKADTGDAHQNHVIGGFKATLNNDKTGDQAKAHAREVLDNTDGESVPQDVGGEDD